MNTYKQIVVDWSRVMNSIRALWEELDKKMDSDGMVDAVLEYNINDDGYWYRRYKSGWLEQGGTFKQVSSGYFYPTQNLIKPFIDNKYTLLVTTSYSGNAYEPGVYERTTTSFKVYNLVNQEKYGASWYACGQGA